MLYLMDKYVCQRFILRFVNKEVQTCMIITELAHFGTLILQMKREEKYVLIKSFLVY